MVVGWDRLNLFGNYDPMQQETNKMAMSKGSLFRALLTGPNMSTEVLVYMVTFFLAMVFMELALEMATTEFGELDALASAVTLFQFGFCLVLPLVQTQGQGIRRFPQTTSELVPYINLSFVIFGATALATRAVKYVSYPTKVIFKSAKLIPTMVMATALQRKMYTPLEYLSALLLCLGAAGYSFGSASNRSSTIPSNDETNDYTLGITLLTISIFCDAIVPNLQKVLMSPPDQLPAQINKSTVSGLTASELMINTNTIGFGCVLLYMLGTNQLWDALQTSLVHPLLVLYLVLIGLGLATAVLAYTKLIQATDSVVAVKVATLRKVVTVVLSYVLFPKPLLLIHFIAGLSVLGGILLGAYAKENARM